MCNKDAEHVYAPLVIVSIGAGKRTLAGKTVYNYGSIDTSLDPLLFSLDSIFKFTLRCQQYDIVPIIFHRFSLTPEANLPLVSTTTAVPVAKFAAGVIDTRGKFATGVVDTGGAPSLGNISANFRKNLK